MLNQNVLRGARQCGAVSMLRRTASGALRGRSSIRPYTFFNRGGLYRYRLAEPHFKPFRVV